MLYITIVTLLIASNGIPSIQAEETEERKSQWNETSVNGGDIVIEVLTTQENNTFNTGPNDKSKYGSIVEVKTNTYESSNSRQPDSTQTRTYTALGGPGHDGVSYVKSEERNHQEQPNQNQTLDDGVRIIVNAKNEISGNSFDGEPDSNNIYGTHIKVISDVYKSDGNNNLTQPNKKQISSNGDPIRLITNTRITNNHISVDPEMKVTIGNFITHRSYSNSQTDEKAPDNKEEEVYEEKHTESNGQ